jgi:hypothetical protein
MICLAHLVRKANGPEAFRTFLESYRHIEPGVDHELVLLLKGFDSPADAGAILSLAEGLASDKIFLPDSGFDIGSYLAAAHELDYDSFCFLNSFSVIKSAGWLGKLAAALGDGVGLVGASGSWTSHYSLLAYDLGFGPYRHIFRCEPERLAALELARARGQDFRGPLRRGLAATLGIHILMRHFDSFPSYHVRTNAFLVPRDVIREVRTWKIETKLDAWRFESGRRCLLRQVEQMGLRGVVVGADGELYEKERWHESNTFWQSQQENLVVEDNQSRDYRDGDGSRRLFLSLLAWGDAAKPVIPPADTHGPGVE